MEELKRITWREMLRADELSGWKLKKQRQALSIATLGSQKRSASAKKYAAAVKAVKLLNIINKWRESELEADSVGHIEAREIAARMIEKHQKTLEKKLKEATGGALVVDWGTWCHISTKDKKQQII